MKVMNITDIDKFFGVIDRCDEKVELVTENGDIYNLKSKLSQFASLTKVFFNGVIPVVELVTYSPSDAGKIMHYMMNNK
ncbi:MAG: polya polymerase [Agathobacter sp.]|nr:polya polymerase [Agathobacter sp.]